MTTALPSPMQPAIQASAICKRYDQGPAALDQVSLEVRLGEVLVVMGPSGSGKSTLIRTFNGLEAIDAGALNVLGIHLDADHDERQIRRIRRRVGMVFQQFNLFPHLSILDNITLAPIRVQKRSRQEAESQARQLLEQMGIAEHIHKRPGQLSGGQQQRVAIARALALKPEVMLFDEPTSALDPERVKEVLLVIQTVLILRKARPPGCYRFWYRFTACGTAFGTSNGAELPATRRGAAFPMRQHAPSARAYPASQHTARHGMPASPESPVLPHHFLALRRVLSPSFRHVLPRSLLRRSLLFNGNPR